VARVLLFSRRCCGAPRRKPIISFPARFHFFTAANDRSSAQSEFKRHRRAIVNFRLSRIRPCNTSHERRRVRFRYHVIFAVFICYY